MNMSDRMAAFFSPSWGLKRASARKALNVVRGYEAATKGKRFANWISKSEGDSKIWAAEAETLNARAKDAVRNNGWAKSAVEEFVNTMVGPGMQPTFIDEVSQKVVEDLDRPWRVWASKKFCDYERSKTFGAIQRLAIFTWFTQGESFIRKMIVNDNKYIRDPSVLLPPISYHVLGPEMIDKKAKGENVINGIEYKDSRPVKYHIFTTNPLEDRQAKSKAIPAEEVYHLFLERFPGQSRGFTELSAALKPLRQGDELEDAALMQRKISACLTGFITGVDFDEEGEPTYEIPDTLEPGSITHLPPDADVKFSVPPVVSDFKDVTKNQHHKASAATSLSYEGVTKDLSQTNYSSMRGGRNMQEKAVSALRLSLVIPNLLDLIVEDFLEAMGAAPTVIASWTPPPSLTLDPEKEGKANESQVRNGFATLPDIIERSGKNPRLHIAEIQKSNESLDSLGIVLDSDPRKVTKSGQLQVENDPDT